MHSFGVTERWIVLAEFPFVVDPLRLALANKPYIENYRWLPELGTRLTLIDRATGRVGHRLQTDACFAFHHVNAFERGTEVVVDICAYPDPRLVKDLYLDRLRAGKAIARPDLVRLRLDLARHRVDKETVADGVELPRINYLRHNARPYSHVWATDTGPTGWIEKVVKVDVSTGDRREWSEPGLFPGEPVFVERPAGGREDDGVLLTVVLDPGKSQSSLLVLDASTLEERARVAVGHHIPFSFHGQFTAEVPPP
jgi:carotenoid cleavage dioxygenase-like enzyme